LHPAAFVAPAHQRWTMVQVAPSTLATRSKQQRGCRVDRVDPLLQAAGIVDDIMVFLL
jgi:hypothetical protein